MPHLQFETTVSLESAEKRAFSDEIADLYAEHMETGTDHVAVTVRTRTDGGFYLGRLEAGDDAVMLNADIREGRPFDQRRAFVRAAFETACDRWDVPIENMYGVLTEHGGEHFHEYDRVLSSWGDHETEEGV